ncbi:MAG: PBP1A family penicillin-binding protein [Gemmatimonadetes bacterium]|nr:PBP1A family penicillin-binding protein [Gemmatimonadota bacterium]
MTKRLLLLSIFTFGFLCCYALFLAGIYLAFNDNLPDIDAWSFQPKRITRVFSADGKHLKNFLEENREILTYEEIPEAMQEALVAIEDQRFYSHWGIDMRRIFGAALANLRSMDLTAQGASTITQQLARNLFSEVGDQRSSASLEAVLGSYARKVREQITAVQIERLYTKREILTMYLNTVFFGHNCFGLKAAARFYFDKDVDALTIDECALLAGLLPAPNIYSPFRNPDKARRRRNQVLAGMVQTKKLSTNTYRKLQNRPVIARRSQRAATYGLAPYFIEYVRQQLERQYGSGLYRDGVTVHTTLDSRLQEIAEKHFAIEIGRVHERVNQYLARQDSSEGLPDSAVVQAAFIAMDPRTGHILAMIGGRDFSESKFNRATQAKRQAGSSFKPFVYTAAIDNNRFTIDMLEDNAITIWEEGKLWDPENYDKKFRGPMTLREGFKQSRNLIAIKLADQIGPGLIRRYARNMGITTRINAVPSIGIGTSDVHLLDLVSAYCVFPNKGIYVEPMSVAHIVDKEGNTSFEKQTGRRREVLRPATAVIMTDMLRSAIDEQGGTGHSIRTFYRFKPDAAGKTGTTNDYRDAWFIGFTPHIVAGVWV